MIQWFTSTFLSPWGALLGLTLPAVILLYLLKLKRTRREVPSILLWRQSLEDLTANSPFQKLRSSPLLLLQLLLLALLTLAMMRPTLNLESVRGLDYYVLVDCSASMASTDVKPNRLANAKEQIREQIRDLGQGDRMMIVSFSSHSEVVVPLTDDRGELLSGLERLGIQETGTNLTEAIPILKASVGEETDVARILLYSDGRIRESEDLFPPSVETVYHQVGERGQNVGISRFSVTASPASDEETQVFVEVVRDGETQGAGSLSLEWDGNLVDAHRFEWKEQQTYSHVFRTHSFPGGLLTVSIDTADDLTVDDRASAYLKTVDPLRVQLVCHGDSPLIDLLRLVPETRLEVTAPEAFSATTTAEVVVFDAWSPEALPPGPKGFLFLGTPPPGIEGLGWGEEVEYPIVLDWKRTHPVVRGADYRNLQVARAFRLQPPDMADVLIESRETPLLFSLEYNTKRLVVGGFPLLQSNWARLYSFPITITNAIRWLGARGSRMEVAPVFQTGAPLEIVPEKGQESVVVRDPEENETRIEVTPGQRVYYSSTQRTGKYELGYSDGVQESVWLNLLDGEESLTAPKDSLAFGKEEIHATEKARPRNQEVWTWIALVAFIVLMAEWWLYTKQAWM